MLSTIDTTSVWRVRMQEAGAIEMKDKLHFKGPLFEFSATGPYAICAAVLLICLLVAVGWR
jgi:hypothetical protein